MLTQIAFSTVAFDGYSFEEGTALLAKAGVRNIEPAYIEGYTPFSEDTFTEAKGAALKSVLDRLGVRARALSAHIDLGRPDSLERLLRRVDFAAGLGVATLISNATRADRLAAFDATINAALPLMAEAGIVLAVENPGHGVGALVPDGAAGARLVSRYDSPFLRLNYDIGNALTYARGDIDLCTDLNTALPHAQRLHLKDLREQNGDWHFCPIGDGIVGYGRRVTLNSALIQADLAVEHPLRLWRPGRSDPVRRAARPSASDIQHAVAKSLRFLSESRMLEDWA